MGLGFVRRVVQGAIVAAVVAVGGTAGAEPIPVSGEASPAPLPEEPHAEVKKEGEVAEPAQVAPVAQPEAAPESNQDQSRDTTRHGSQHRQGATADIRDTIARPRTPERPPVSPNAQLRHRAVQDRHLIVSVERLFGVHAWRAHATFGGGQPAGESDLHGTMVNLLGNSNTNSPEGVLNPFAAPRLTADAILPFGFTLGAGLGFLSVSGEREDRTPAGTSTTTPFSDGNAFLIAPRAGWLHSITEWLAVWPRVGVTFVAIGDANGNDRTSLHFTTLSADPALVFTPLEHVAVLVGPALDFALGGGGETVQGGTSRDVSTSFSNFGAALGAAVDI